jgi:hypothetical protein
MSLRLTPDRRPIGGRRSTCESRRYTVLSASPDSSPYIHPPSVHHSPSKTWTPSPFTAHRSFQETPSPAYLMGEALMEKHAETSQERQKLLRTIVAGNHSRLRTLHALAVRIQPFLPVLGGARTLPFSHCVFSSSPASSTSTPPTKLSVRDLRSRATTLSSDTSLSSVAPTRISLFLS